MHHDALSNRHTNKNFTRRIIGRKQTSPKNCEKLTRIFAILRKKTTVLIVSANRMLRDGLTNSFHLADAYQVLAAAEFSQELIIPAAEHSPDIVLMETPVPNASHVNTARQMLVQYPGSKIIILSTSDAPQKVWDMLNAGVSAYLLNSCSFKELLKAVDSVLLDQIYLCPEVTGAIIDNALATYQNKKDPIFSLLSQREREVLQLISEGHSAKEIAKKLFISSKTVQIHRAHLKKKLNLSSTAELTKYAVSKGITSLDFFLKNPPPKDK